MSSDHKGENPLRRKPKVSPAMLVRGGLGDILRWGRKA